MATGGGGGGVLREILARFGFEVDDKKLKRIDKDVEAFKGKLQQVAVVLAGGVLVKRLVAVVSEVAEMGSEVHDTALSLGVSTTALQQWRYVAGQAGVDAGALSMGFGLLQKKALDATRGGEAAKAFKRLGISVKTTTGELKDPATLFEEVGLKIGAMQNETERTGTALEFFGRSGKQLIPVFTEGPEAIARMKAELRDLGAELSQEQIDRLDEYGDNVARLTRLWDALHIGIAMSVLPMFERIVTGLLNFGKAAVRVTSNSHILESALMAIGAAAFALGIAIVAAWTVPALVVGAVAVGMLLLAAITDDLWVTWEGGDSVTRRLIDWLFWTGATTSAVATLRNQIIPTMDAMQRFAGMGTQFSRFNTFLWAVVPPLQLWRLLLGTIWSSFKEIETAAARAVNVMIAALNAINVTGADRLLFPFLGARGPGQQIGFRVPELGSAFDPGGNFNPTVPVRPSSAATAAAGAGIGTGVQVSNTVHVHAGAAGAQEVAAIVRRELATGMVDAVETAEATVGRRWGGVAGR